MTAVDLFRADFNFYSLEKLMTARRGNDVELVIAALYKAHHVVLTGWTNEPGGRAD